PDRRVLDPDRPGDPGRRRQLRLRHPQTSARVVRGTHGVDRRDALPRSPPPRAAGPRRGEVEGVRDRPPSQVLPDHVPGPRSARRRTQTVAGGGPDATGHLAHGGDPDRPPALTSPTSTGSLSNDDPGSG